MSAVESLQKGAYHIANNKVEYNPQRKSNFTLIVNGLDDIKKIVADDVYYEDDLKYLSSITELTKDEFLMATK